MANEITVKTILTYTGQVYLPTRPMTFPDMQITQSTKVIDWRIVTAPYHSTNGAAISFANLTAKGYAVLVNLDSTNFVEVGSGTGTFVPILKIPPLKRISVFFLNSATPTWRADTADCQVMAYLFDL